MTQSASLITGGLFSLERQLLAARQLPAVHLCPCRAIVRICRACDRGNRSTLV